METTYEHFELKKSPKLNPVTKQEETIELVEITDTETMVRRTKGLATSEETHPTY